MKKRSLLCAVALLSLPVFSQAALTTSRQALLLPTPVADGTINVDEYGVGNPYSFTGAGNGFGGTLGGGTIYMANNATDLFIGYQPGANHNDYTVIYLNTKAGGFDDAGMNDVADAGRNVVTNLGSFGNETFPAMSSNPDYAVLIGDTFTVVFELTAGSLNVVTSTGAGATGANTNPREVQVSLANLGMTTASKVEWFAAYCSPTNFLSDESMPASAALQGSSPGNTATGTYANHHEYIPLAGGFDNSAGTDTAYVSVGAGGTYATMGAAATAFSGVTGNINRPWRLYVIASTTETDYHYMGNNFGTDGMLTIKPAPGVTPELVWNNTNATPPGYWAHFTIGAKNNALVDATNVVGSNGKYVIDGSNTEGGTTRDLTLRAGSSGTSLASGVNRLLAIASDNDGVVLKNTNILFYDTAGSASAMRLVAANVAGLGDLTPDNTVINNCYLVSRGASNNGFGIETGSGQGTLTSGVASISGTQITNNLIEVKQRGIFGQAFTSATITGNTFNISSTSAAVTWTAFLHLNSNNVTGWTQTIANNTITMAGGATTGTAGQGPSALLLDSGPTGGTYNVYNNVIKSTGYTLPTTAVDALFRGISTASITSTYNIEHNSIEWISNATGATASRCAAIAAPLAFTTGALNIRNNNIRFGAGGGAIIYAAGAAKVTSAGNNLFPTTVVNTGNVVGAAGTPFANLAAWQAAGYDVAASGGQSVDPTTTTPAWDANFRFAQRPITGLGTVASSQFATDIDGNARPAIAAIPGVDEPPLTPAGVNPPTAVALSNATVNENVAVGSLVGYINVTDADAGDAFSAALAAGTGDTNNALFSVVGGEIRTAAALDFETLGASLSIRLNATDLQSNAFAAPIAITLANVNEAPTAITPTPGTPTVAEGAAAGTSVATLAATDPDAAETFVYTLVAGTGDTNNALFQIVGNDLQVLGALDFDTLGAALTVRVQVQDQGGTGLTFATAIPITLTNVVGEIDVTPLAKNFGPVTIGSTPTDTITITNTSTEELSISALSISGVDQAAYSLVSPPTLPVSVVNGTPLVLTVQFAPSAAVAYNDATLVITSNDLDEGTVNVDLDGSGVSSVNEWNLLND